MIPNFAAGLLEPRETLELHRSLRGWVISFLLFGGISMYGTDAWDFAWGIVLLITLILTWKIKNPVMFLVFAVIMSWSAFINILSVVLGEGPDKLWYLVGLAQALWVVFETKQYEKYRHLRAKNESVALDWLDRGSTYLSLFSIMLLILPVNSCVAGSQSTAMQPWVSDLMDALVYAFMDVNVLALALGLAVVIHKKQSIREITSGVVISSIFLAITLSILLLGSLV